MNLLKMRLIVSSSEVQSVNLLKLRSTHRSSKEFIIYQIKISSVVYIYMLYFGSFKHVFQ